MTPRRVALFSLAATCLFFLEYLPPFKRVHLPFDLEGFHYPLLNYAFQSLRAGRFPEWDPSIYCGLSFAGNLQAGLFYPPNWLLFALSLPRGGLAFKAVEALVIAHLWLAFVLAYCWLRGRQLGPLASSLGAAVFAFGGYTLSQIQHYGVIAAYAWLPLGLLALDQYSAQRRRQPLWKLAAASALAFLAGYPPAWFTFCVLVLVYAGRRILPAAAALAFSLLLSMIQLLPALEAATLKTPENKYGGGIQGLEFYLSYFLPNYFNLNRSSTAPGEPTAQYFYLGAPVLFALLWAVYRRRLRPYLPALALAAVSLVFMTNPFHLLERLISGLPLLPELCRDWNFLAGLPLAAALLTALALDDFLDRPASHRHPLARLALPLVLAWCFRQFWIWLPGGRDFSSSWAAALEPAVTVALFSLVLFTSRSPVLLLLLVATDYKVFGTDRRFNAVDLDPDQFYADARSTGRPLFRGLDDQVYGTLLANPAYRLVIDNPGPHPTDLRHYRLSTPQGFDPLLPAPYKRLIESLTPFRTDRLFDIDPSNHALLRLLGVRYFLTSTTVPPGPEFQPLPPADSFFRVYEYLHAKPIYRWEDAPGTARVLAWTPERRELLVRSPSGGRFVLIEQFFPGWTATVDGRSTPIEPYRQAFQSIAVAPGEHRIQFQFRSRGLRLGAVLSAAAVFLLCLLARRR